MSKRVFYVDFNKVNETTYSVQADYKEVGMANITDNFVTFHSDLPMFSELVENRFESLDILESEIKMTFYH